MRTAIAALLTGIALLAPWSAGPAVADNSDFDQLADPATDLKDLAGKLEGIARRLRSGLDVTPVGALTVVSPGADSERTAIGERLAGIWRTESEALRSIGFEPPADPPTMTVIVVRVKGPSSSVKATGGPVLLLRLGDTGHPAEPAGVGPRPDGAAIPRDAVQAARAVRLWQAAVSDSASSRSGETYAFARQVVATSVKRDATPKWMYEGLISWVESRAAGNAVPSHFCRPFAAPSPALLKRVLEGDPAASPVTSRFLGRFVGALIEGRSDVGKLLPSLAGDEASSAKAIQTAFGMSADDALAKACAGLKDTAGPCDDAGQMPCPACKGAAKVELACADCVGTGSITCPSCRGLDGCPAGCDRGFVTYVGGKKVKCHVCSGGKLKCQACAGAMKSACKSCGGSGKGTWPCLACRGTGKIACPELGAAADTVGGSPCPWCQDASRQSGCPDCGGIGYAGCDACSGTLRQVCGDCDGTGERRMVYADGTTASASKCSGCDGKGWFRCDECKNGRKDCATCHGKGRGKFEKSGCPACVEGKLPTVAELRAPAAKASDGGEATANPDPAAEAEKIKAMTDKAVAFLLTCNQTKDGSFALRRFRAKGREEAGALEEPTLFSNAKVLWTLAMVGIDVNDKRTERAWKALRTQAQEVVDKTAEWSGTQATGLAIRALSAAGEDPKSPLLRGLVDRLCRGQHASGWWGHSLDEKDPDDELDSLFALESLRVARVKGVRVPSAVWGKALRAASAEFDVKGPAGMKSDFMSVTTVLSNMSLVVMAKEGSLGAKATAFDYQSMPAIKKGLAWLDRYFDIRREAMFVRGAACRNTTDAGYSAFIFSAQRLAMLLSIEVLAGERWHSSGARYLGTIQHKDGSFEETSFAHLNGPVRTTASCVLFLIRATPPITNSADDE
jgi:hypothetical protein